MSAEQPFNPEQEVVYVPFEEADTQEQIARTRSLRETFGTGSSFRDFWDSAHKYHDQFPMPGKSAEEIQSTIDMARQGVTLVDEALELFKQVKVKESSNEGNLRYWVEQIQEDNVGREFITKGQLDVKRMAAMVQWANEVHRRLGEKLGRPHGTTEIEDEHALEDLKYILTKDNDYLPKRETPENGPAV